MPTIVHFEIPSDDVERSKKFYSELFGWTIEKFQGTDNNMPADMEYYVITIEEQSKKVEKLGGKIMLQKTAVPGMGYFAICSDTENNTFAIWETDSTAK